VGFVVDEVGTGAGFLRVLRFPLPIFIPSTAPHSSSLSSGAGSVSPNPKKVTKKGSSHLLQCKGEGGRKGERNSLLEKDKMKVRNRKG
jgi:hypothetical protein